jgi:hypothetical protein
MRILSPAAAILTLTAMPVLADDVATFDQACRSVGGDAAVCACKAIAAVDLLDERMLSLVIVSMTDPGGFAAMSNSGAITHADNVAWTNYIRESNKACNLSY